MANLKMGCMNPMCRKNRLGLGVGLGWKQHQGKVFCSKVCVETFKIMPASAKPSFGTRLGNYWKIFEEFVYRLQSSDMKSRNI